MLASPIDEKTLASLDLADWQIEWKWDGARIQLVSAEEGSGCFRDLVMISRQPFPN